MKKLTLMMAMILIPFFVGLALLEFEAMALTQPRSEINDHWAGTDENLLPAEANNLYLTGRNVYTIYLPLIFVSPISPKKGVAATASPACPDAETLQASWYFNWGVHPDPSCGGTGKFVPRIYGADSMQWLDQAVANAQSSGWLIGFSEPNLTWQGYVPPAQAAVLWREIEVATAAAGIKLVSPSPNQWEPGQHEPYGHQWLWVMVDEYQRRYNSKPRFDAIAWNIYADKHNDTVAYLTARHNEALARDYDVPIWVLEYAGKCWRAPAYTGNQEIMTKTTAWFEATPWIGRYAWFANRLDGPDPAGTDYTSCTLIVPSTGQLTTLGQIYQLY